VQKKPVQHKLKDCLYNLKAPSNHGATCQIHIGLLDIMNEMSTLISLKDKSKVKV